MASHAESSFKIESWNEDPYSEDEGSAKLTRASVKQRFEGDIGGEGEVEWLMCYRPDETADFVGLQRVVGRVGEREGTFVLQSSGTFDGKTASGPLTVVAGSGTGGLEGITGRGELIAPMGGTPTVALEYDFES
jgi:Protein of unknown function (DUF3224)